MKHYLYDILIEKGVSEQLAVYLNMIGLVIALLILVLLIDYITKRLLWRVLTSVAKRTKTNFDDILITNKLPRNIAHIIPLVILIEFLPDVLSDFLYVENIIERALKVLAILLTLRVVRCLLMSVRDYLKSLSQYKDKPIYSYIQVFMIFLWVVATFSILAIVTGISFWKFFAGIGTASAIIILDLKNSFKVEITSLFKTRI